MKDAAAGIPAYGKGTTTVGVSTNTDFGYAPGKAAADYITVKIAADGNVSMTFNKD